MSASRLVLVLVVGCWLLVLVLGSDCWLLVFWLLVVGSGSGSGSG